MSKEVKELKKVKIYFDTLSHWQEMNRSAEIAAVFKSAKIELESILEKPIEDYTAFSNDPLLYAIAAIKDKYPGAFNLMLPLDKTLAMLSISLQKMKNFDGILKTTPHKINICSKSGEATHCEDNEEEFCSFAQTPEQHERLQFCNDLIANLEKCHKYAPYRGKHNLVTGLAQFVYLDPQLGIVCNHHFVLNGIQ